MTVIYLTGGGTLYVRVLPEIAPRITSGRVLASLK